MFHWEEISYTESRAKERKELARYLKQIYISSNKKTVFDIAQLIANKYQDKHPRVAQFLEEDLEPILTFFDHPGYPPAQDPDYQSNRGSAKQALKAKLQGHWDIPQPGILS